MTVDLLKPLLDFLLSQKEIFDDYKMKVNEKIDVQIFLHIDKNQRARKSKTLDGDGSVEDLCSEQMFKIETYMHLLDRLCKELSKNVEA